MLIQEDVFSDVNTRKIFSPNAKRANISYVSSSPLLVDLASMD
jgi:hypothetical protein